jgi:hypothetical protein
MLNPIDGHALKRVDRPKYRAPAVKWLRGHQMAVKVIVEQG